MLIGENGILTQANDAKTSTEIADEKEKVELSAVGALAKDNGGEIKRDYLNDELTSYIGTEGTDYSLSESETAPFVVTYSDSGRSYLIDENGNVSEYVQVGQLVDYDPTVLDKSGTPVDAEGIAEENKKLVYKSPIGSGTEHGNGNKEQIFTAKANSDLKWRVLNIENGVVQLISENVIQTDAGSNFVMYGAPGYLYAEQELNEICKIYGYGYGADTTQVTTYTYGGPKDLDENGKELTGKITGSGARSITIEDINKKAGIYEDATDGKMKYSDGTVINDSYGSTEKPTTEIFYPTIATSNGKSSSKGVKNLECTYYSYNKGKIENPEVQNMLFNGSYWLASRCVVTNSGTSYFHVRGVNSNYPYTSYLCSGNSSRLNEYTLSYDAVRPIVILKSNIIDIEAGYNEETGWSLK